MKRLLRMTQKIIGTCPQLLIVTVLLTTSSIVRADTVSLEATVSASQISLDEVLQLTLTVTGVNQDLDPINIPVVDGFSAKYLGPSTSVSIVNGDYHSTRSFIYDLFPNKVGHFQIPAITATIAGQSYTTKPIDIEVLQNASQAQASSGGTDQNQPPSAESLKDKILIQVSVPQTNVYLNEGLPLTVKLLVNSVPVRDIQYPQFDRQGFSVDDFEKPEQSSEIVNGLTYDTVEFKTNIYPNHLGDITIGPIQIQGNVLYKSGDNNSPFSQDSFFGASEIFNNMFDYQARPITVSSKPIVLHVSALPQTNRPQDFSGAIGQFDFQASVAPLQVKAGDPLTLKMDVEGTGDFRDMKLPEFAADGFKTYAPQIKSTGNHKIAEQVIIPTNPQITQVPALHFSYFDTGLNDYKTITQGPFAIHVTAPNPDEQFKAVGFSDISKEPVVAANQFSWEKTVHNISKLLNKLFHSFWFWLVLGLVVIAMTIYFLWRRFQERLENDPAFARRLRAVKEAFQVLDQAQKYIATAQSKDFYALLSKALREYLANKWHGSAPALSVNEITSRLKTAGCPEDLISQVKSLLEQSDLVCFAGSSVDSSKMQADLAQAQKLIMALEKIF